MRRSLLAPRVIEAEAARPAAGVAEINQVRPFGPHRPHSSTTPLYFNWLEFKGVKGCGEEWRGPAKQKAPAAFFWGSFTCRGVGEEATDFFKRKERNIYFILSIA